MRTVFLGLILALLGSNGAALAQSADAAADFAARCAGAGVVKCVGFDNTTADIVRGTNLHPDGAGTYRAALDTSQKASGQGSLRFDLPPPPHSGANIAGSWAPSSNDGLGRLFGQNSTFYVQFRQRFSPEMLNNSWTSSWKTVIFHNNQTTCGNVEITTNNHYMSGLAVMYTECGSRHLYTTLDGTRYTESTPLLMQQGGYRCQYGEFNNQTCFYFPANEWVTFYYRIQIGNWGQANSSVEAWVARESDTAYKQFIKVPGFTLNCNNSPCGQNEGYNNLTLTPYMTGLPSSSGSSGARVWYDDLIVSTQPIPVPTNGNTVRPNPPTSVTAQ
jgi:hypothetical protein